jgi:glyceraldehyde-3-phosphate dehydrogenase (NAD(P))
MSVSKVQVLLNGYGVIGKRIADAVTDQEDMQMVGITDVVSDWRIKMAVEKGYPVSASTGWGEARPDWAFFRGAS